MFHAVGFNIPAKFNGQAILHPHNVLIYRGEVVVFDGTAIVLIGGEGGNILTAVRFTLADSMMNFKYIQCLILCGVTCHTIGCASSRTSDTARTATEQVLISNAIDRSLSNVSFDQLSGRKVFIDDKYLDSVDKGYVMGSIRHKSLSAGAYLAKSVDDADLVLEPRSGGVGTDSEDSFIGIPKMSVPGTALSLPDLKLVSRNTQLGTAKIGLVAFDPKTGASVGLGGQSTALTKHDDMYVLGMGPFRSGAVRQERENAVGFQSPTGAMATMTGQKPDRLAKRSPVNLVDGSTTRVAELPTPPLIETTVR